MDHTKIHIKNMVCPRCISTVQQVFNSMNIDCREVRLGEVIVSTALSEEQRSILSEKLKKNGFELLQDQKSKLINQIKSVIIKQIHHSHEPLTTNFSTLLSDQLHHEYTSMSKLFSMVEGITIERFILKQKIERVKEFLFYDELTLTEIAYQMNYSSVAHLSTQFKKETGMTPSEFKKLRNPGHDFLDKV